MLISWKAGTAEIYRSSFKWKKNMKDFSLFRRVVKHGLWFNHGSLKSTKELSLTLEGRCIKCRQVRKPEDSVRPYLWLREKVRNKEQKIFRNFFWLFPFNQILQLAGHFARSRSDVVTCLNLLNYSAAKKYGRRAIGRNGNLKVKMWFLNEIKSIRFQEQEHIWYPWQKFYERTYRRIPVYSVMFSLV